MEDAYIRGVLGEGYVGAELRLQISCKSKVSKLSFFLNTCSVKQDKKTLYHKNILGKNETGEKFPSYRSGYTTYDINVVKHQ